MKWLRKNGIWVGLAVVAVIVLSAVFLANPNTSATAALPKEVTVAKAAELRDGGAFILDVRQPEEWNAGHIPDATLIPLDQLPSRVNEVPKDQTVVVVCRSGNRSAAGRDILLEAGFKSVTSMGGGMNSWAAKGLPMVTGP